MSTQMIETAFKTTKSGQKVYADIVIPSTAKSDKPLPILIWWHGGGLLLGSHKEREVHLERAPEKHDLILISADYRLAPQVGLPDILEDTSDLVLWTQTDEFIKLCQGKADPSQIFLSGSSAGGWLAMLTGSGIGFHECGLKSLSSIKIRGVLGIYPISDLQHSFWKTKQRPASFSDRIIEQNELKYELDPSSQIHTFSNEQDKRSNFYTYMVQEALLSSLLLDRTNIDPQVFSVGPAYHSGAFHPPPTFLVHGTKDRYVPYQQSSDVYDAIRTKYGSEHVEFVIVKGGDHGFDEGEDQQMVEMYRFINKYRD